MKIYPNALLSERSAKFKLKNATGLLPKSERISSSAVLAAFICVLLMAFSANFSLIPAAEAEINIRGLGAAGDGMSNDAGFFLRALEDISGAPGAIRIPRGTYVIADNITFPENVTLVFEPGGELFITGGREITISGAIEAGVSRIFSGEAAVRGRIKNLHVYPQWFGARGDAERDDAPALQRAADLAADSLGRTLFISEGEYLLKNSINIRCNIESRGLIISEIEIDEERTTFSTLRYFNIHYPKRDVRINFVSDHDEVELNPEYFAGLEAGDIEVPVYRDVPLADGSGKADLREGGTLRLFLSDFLRRGHAGWYDRNDITQFVSSGGDVFPEFAFDYHLPPEAEAWRRDRVYERGEYVSHDGETFKALAPSGRGVVHTHPHLGEAEISPVEPQPGGVTRKNFEYRDGTTGSRACWRLVQFQAWYRKNDAPLSVNGLRVEVRLKNNRGESMPISMLGAVRILRNNMTFNNLQIFVSDREALVSTLLRVENCVNIEFNNGYFSGATFHGLGYNILNRNNANIRYNNCTSTNSRKGMDGRHGKNITITGGFYNNIDNHYGRNLVIKDVFFSGLSTHVPGYRSPDIDLESWRFGSHWTAVAFEGANIHIENCTVDRARGILTVRADIGDLEGKVVLRDVYVRRNAGNVMAFKHEIVDWEYYRERAPGIPDNLIIENITLGNPEAGELRMEFGRNASKYGPVYVRNTPNIGRVHTGSHSTTFVDCGFDSASFHTEDGALVNLRNNVFSGNNSGLNQRNTGIAAGNVLKKGARASFPMEYLNRDIYDADR